MSGDIWDEVAMMEDEKPSPLSDVSVNVTVVLGDTTMPIHALLRLGRGAVIALDTTEDDDVHLYVGEMEVAAGQLRLNGERIEISVSNASLRPVIYRRPSDPFCQDEEIEEVVGEETSDDMALIEDQSTADISEDDQEMAMAMETDTDEMADETGAEDMADAMDPVSEEADDAPEADDTPPDDETNP
ncbi:MAG: FliM/FliN family flagellar motor switch protein [Pseudomonadota bacterium]